MKLLLSLGITLCFLQYVSPKVDIPAIFQKPKQKLNIPTMKSLDIRETTSEEYDCVGKPDGNNVNPSGDCKSFYACVKNTTFYVVCPEFPEYQTYFNPNKKLCDKSDPLACLQALELPDGENKTSEKNPAGDDGEGEKSKDDNEERDDDEESKTDKEKENLKEKDAKSDETEDNSSKDENNSEETDDKKDDTDESEEDSSREGSEENEKDEL